MELKQIAKKYGIPEDIKGTCSLENIKERHLTFLADLSYKHFLKPNQKVAVLTSKKNYAQIKSIKGNSYIIVDNPHHAFIEFHNSFHKDFVPFNTGNEAPVCGKNCRIDKMARFGKNVKIGSNVLIYPYAVIGSNVSIGDNTKIFPCASIYDNVRIGKNCIIDSGSTIGGEGFSTVLNEQHGAMRLTNIGGVDIGDNVEVGNNTTIDRASFLFTKIGNNVRIDNLIHVAHNVSIGDDTRIAALTCIGGSARIGKRVWIGVGCTIIDHASIGDDCQVLMNAVLINSIGNGMKVSGFYAMPHSKWIEHTKEMSKKYNCGVEKKEHTYKSYLKHNE